MVEKPDLRIVADPDDGAPAVCAACGEPATTTSAADGRPLCLSCFTGTHWHPSWQRSFDER